MGIKLGVVAGELTDNLCEYLTKIAGNTIEIDYKTNSLYSDESNLNRMHIKLDKFVFVLDDNHSTRNIRGDINVLGSMLDTSNRFISIQEVFVFATRNKIIDNAIESLNFILDDVGYKNVHIVRFDSEIENEAIFNTLLNIKSGNVHKTKHKKVYMIEVNSETKKSYEAEDNSTHKVEPFSFKNLITYEKMKNKALDVESGNDIIDEPVKNIIKNDIYLGRMGHKKKQYSKCINIVCGESMSRVRQYSSALAISAYQADKKILVIDCSKYGSCVLTLKSLTKKNNIKPLYCNVENVLSNEYDLKHEDFIIANCGDIANKNLWLNYIKFFLSQITQLNLDCVIIDCDIDYLYDLVTYCGVGIQNIFVCSQTLKEDIMNTLSIVNNFRDKYKLAIMLNNNLFDVKGYEVLSSVDIKDILGDVRILSPTDMTDCIITSELNDVFIDS